MIGSTQSDVRHLEKSATAIKRDVETIKINQTDMKSKQAYLEGVVSTKLDAIQASVSKTEKRVDDLMRVP
jgi:hypothetical protein